jgi:hypothetical protein
MHPLSSGFVLTGRTPTTRVSTIIIITTRTTASTTTTTTTFVVGGPERHG